MLEHDVLVIGAGLAGMRAAIAARANGASTAIISKVHPVRSHSNAAQGVSTRPSPTVATTGKITPTRRSRGATSSATRTPSR